MDRFFPARALPFLVAAALASPPDSRAVSLDADGRGQVLLYPYYTVQSAAGNAFNTYISVVNRSHDSDKALRVRFREARNGREVASLNLYLGRNDVWTGVLVPDGAGTRLITGDASCTDPPISPERGVIAAPSGLAFSNAAFTGPNADDAGNGLDRTREGYVEILEMGTLSGAGALAAGHLSDGFPANCPAVRPAPQGTIGAPSGGLSGTLTLINVASGMDFTVAAEALADVASRAYFRPASDPYPALDVAEVDPVSVVAANGSIYRSQWARGIDAVSAVLMRHPSAEFALDAVADAGTDLLLAFPTRYRYVNATGATPPFRGPPWTPGCGNPVLGGQEKGETFSATFFARNQHAAVLPNRPDFLGPTRAFFTACGAANAMTVIAAAEGRPTLGHAVVASAAGTVALPGPAPAAGSFENGWVSLNFSTPASELTSGPASTRYDPATGIVTPGAHTFVGLPLAGLVVRSLSNGLLTCGGASCQGNYGGAVPLTYDRVVR